MQVLVLIATSTNTSSYAMMWYDIMPSAVLLLFGKVFDTIPWCILIFISCKCYDICFSGKHRISKGN